MADIQALTRIYRRLAIIQSDAPHALTDQRDWLTTTFTSRATEADEGGFQAGSTSFDGHSFSGVFRGATSEERATALAAALDQIDAEIVAEAADEVTPAAAAVLLPRIITAPR